MTFNGTWKLKHSENFDKLMTHMGVNDVKKYLADHDHLKVTLQQTGDNFSIKESSLKQEYAFTLGVPFDYEQANGEVIEGTWVQVGNVLNGTFTGKTDGKPYLAKKEVTGNELVQTYTFDGITAKRIYQKV